MPWVKGQSGNPGGKPKGHAEIERLARSHAPEAITALVEALGDPKTKVAAAKVLLDRGFGAPSQTLNANVSIFDSVGDSAAERIERALEAIAERAESVEGSVTPTQAIQ